MTSDYGFGTLTVNLYYHQIPSNTHFICVFFWIRCKDANKKDGNISSNFNLNLKSILVSSGKNRLPNRIFVVILVSRGTLVLNAQFLAIF